jgi:hypothetical protein
MSDALKSEIDKKAEENLACRNIVREIVKFGVSQRQMMFIIYLLGLEIHDIEIMREITSMVKALSPESFVSSTES